MSMQAAYEEYDRALRQGLKEYKELTLAGKDPNPLVLDEIMEDGSAESSVYVGLVEIPAERIVGTKSAGRISAFNANFLPLLDSGSEFAVKWIALCHAHLSDEGIRDPIVCYEYLGNFYVQEGNKRVSVLKYYGSPRIPGIVHRIIPVNDGSPRIRAYLEFIEFYKRTGLYEIQFTKPGNYANLCKSIGIPEDQEWEDKDRRRLRAYFQYFREAFTALGGDELHLQPEDALLLWLELYPYEDLGKLSATELRKTLSDMWENVVAVALPDPVVQTEPPSGEAKSSILSRIIRPNPIQVAFVHKRTAEESPWTAAHEAGRVYLQETLAELVQTRSYFNANTPQAAEELVEQAVADGADVIFTTSPQLIAASLKASVKHHKIRVLNCSVDMPYSTVRTYYSRIYEGKFLTGAIAGAMSPDGNIGYVGNYPIHGVPASINAFALGAQLTNPNAKIHLKWSCLRGNPTREFLSEGIRVISNRDTAVGDRLYTEYGTYLVEEDGSSMPLGSPCWVWGKFYEHVLRAMIAGTWERDHAGQSVNYWWGMNSGVIDVAVAESLPEGIKTLAKLLRRELQEGRLDPFLRRIVDQKGALRNDGTRAFTPEDLLHMDWLCDNVVGRIPEYEEVLPFSREMVKLLGIRGEQTTDKEA